MYKEALVSPETDFQSEFDCEDTSGVVVSTWFHSDSFPIMSERQVIMPGAGE